MLARMFPVFLVFLVLFLVIAVAGCEGDIGPAGPAGAAGQDGSDGLDGQDGDTVVIAFGLVDGVANPSVIQISGPAAVTATITDIGTGLWDVTVVGTFPGARGVAMASNADGQTDATLTAQISTWSSTQIVFRVAAYATFPNILEDYKFTYLVLGQ
ncbi:MAG: hypothetical protein IH969_03105 [Candidatus Krumholzibacteriota bacterium]|nr:hypothetical protein [Candidatus Krumholzibacteriota bacterium]